MSKNKTNQPKQKVVNVDSVCECEAQKQQLLQLQEREKRLLADYQNLLRRVDSERGQIIRFANQELFESLLPVLDNLQKASSQLNDKGLNLIVNQFNQVLSQFGVEEIEALGGQFDIETMEAVDQRDKGNIVIQVMQKGYKLKNKVLIHAKVILGNQLDEQSSKSNN